MSSDVLLPRCIWPGCGAILSRYSESLVCSCHVARDYNVRHDGNAPMLVLHLLTAAYPGKVDLMGVLGSADKDGVRDVVQKLRRHRHTIAGHAVGYRLQMPHLDDVDEALCLHMAMAAYPGPAKYLDVLNGLEPEAVDVILEQLAGRGYVVSRSRDDGYRLKLSGWRKPRASERRKRQDAGLPGSAPSRRT